MAKINVESNGERVYVFYSNGAYAAKLSNKGAEYYDDSRVERTNNNSFEDFQKEVLKRYSIEVKEEHRPKWA